VAYINMFKKLSVLIAATLLATQIQAAPTVAATKNEPIQVKLENFKVSTNNEGKEVLLVAKEAKPGEVLEYRATYTNVSTKAIGNLVATLPIPKGTEYQAKTAMPVAGAEATLDNVTFAPVPLMTPDKKQPISPKEYRALRWKVSTLKANEAIVVSARVKVSQE
jgi:uncharacterized repeat protein (TIGR01451 family)